MAGDVKEVSKQEVKYREVVWELFQEEVKYLTSKLQPLELVTHLFSFCISFPLCYGGFTIVGV